jgi:hypothetical protein
MSKFSRNFVSRNFLFWENFRENFSFPRKFSRKFLISPKFSQKILRKFSFKGQFFAKSYHESWLFVLKHYPNSTIQLGTSTLKRLSHLLWNRTRILFFYLILSISRIMLVHCIPPTSKLCMHLGIRMFHGFFAYRVIFRENFRFRESWN